MSDIITSGTVLLVLLFVIIRLNRGKAGRRHTSLR